MRKIFFLVLLFILPGYLLINFFFLDKEYFLCPIKYKRDLVIRCDSRGEGLFAAARSGRRLHEGIDLFAEIGTPVQAARSGKVLAAAQNNGMGKYVIILHGDNLTTIYGHLSELYVTKNTFIRQGKIIGAVGKTGNANSNSILPHLHFEVRKSRAPLDPLQYLL